MKKIIKLLLCLLIAFTSLIYVNTSDVYAFTDYSYYPMGCSNFEVAYANDSGGFSKIECFNDFYSAVNKMKAIGDDGVVRHKSSYSPSKIIAMTSGVAYSYPMRNNSTTANVSQYTSPGGKTTYVTKHREVTYFSTESYNNGDGKVYVNLTGFEGYMNLKEVDLIPRKFIKNQSPIYLGGNDTTRQNETPFYTRIYQSHYDIRQNGNYKELVFTFYSGWSSTTWPDKHEMVLGPAADWMNVNSRYYSYNGYDFYSDMEYRNKVGTYFNYYQFLPLRTKSKIGVDAYNRFLNNKRVSSNSKLYNQGQTFIDNQNKYGVNAVLVFAMACLESGYGTSRFAIDRNNFFGWAAFDSDPNMASSFSSPSQAIYEHMAINLRGYLDINDARFFGMHLGNKGSGLNVKYAADPFWGYKIAALAYELDKANNNYNGNLTDYNSYGLGLINTYNIPIYRDANINNQLYKSAYGSTYQKNFIVPILSQDSPFTKIQSTNGIRDNGSLIYHKTSSKINGPEIYNWEKSIGYIQRQYINNLNAVAENNEGKVATGDFVFTTDTLSFKDNKLEIEGQAYRPGIYVNQENTIKYKINMVDELLDESKGLSFDLPAISPEKDKSKFKGSLDISNLTSGSYFISIDTEYSKYTDNNSKNYVTFEVKEETSISVNNKKFSLIYKDGISFLRVDDIINPVDPSPSLEPVPSVEPTVKPEEPVRVENSLRSYVTKVEYLDEAKTQVSISGIAFITGINFDEAANVKHELVITNMETGEKKFIEATTNLLDPINLNDTYTYSKVAYEGILDLATLEEGDYTLRIQVTNNQLVKSFFITSYDTSILPQETKVNDMNICFNQNQLFSYRYEIGVHPYKLDTSIINKPTRRVSNNVFESFEFKDGILSLSGESWIFNVNYRDEDRPEFSLNLMNTSDGSLRVYKLENESCMIDYSQLLKSKYSYKNTCYKANIDLNDLEKGEYIVLLDNKTTSSRDLFEVININSPKIDKFKVNDKTYKFVYTKTRYRLKLIVE